MHASIVDMLYQLGLHEKSPVADLIPAFTHVHPSNNSPYARRTAVAITNALQKYGYPTVLEFKQASTSELCTTRRLTSDTYQPMVIAVHTAIQEVTLLPDELKSETNSSVTKTINPQDDMLDALSPYVRNQEFRWYSYFEKLYNSMANLGLPNTVEGFLSLTPELILTVYRCSTRTTQHVRSLQAHIRAMLDT